MSGFKPGDRITRREVGQVIAVNDERDYVVIRFDSGELGVYSRRFAATNFQRAETPVQRETENVEE